MKLKLSESQDQILLAAITCSLLVLELAFVRLLDILLFPRITSTVITLSLFSFAIGGIYVARLSGQRKDLKDFIESAIFKYLWVCLGSLFVILMLRLPKNVVLTYDIYLFWFLLFLCLLISLPMSIGGAIVVAFFTKSHKVAKTYLFDMLGAGIGVSLFYGLFSPLGPTGLVSLSLFFVLIVCWWIGSEKKHWVGAMLLLPLVGLPILERSYSIRPLVNKMGGLDQGKEIDVSLWDQEGYLSLVSWNDDEDRSAQKVFLYDGGSMASTIYSFDGDYERLRNAFMEDPLKHFSRLTVPLAHYLQRDSHQKAFIIGSGAGQEVKAALMYGASEVVAVDVSRTVLDLSRGLLSGFNGGIYNHPNVRVYYGEGRSTLYTLKETFDIIQMFSLYSSSSLSDNRGALQAVYSLTVEAFKEYFFFFF
ncbi:MAG: hypothetical protein KDD61_02830 [Bdellovibrionales bacterium]|nr:hypothetical protein [Bdellovibrionales bacterium]